MVSFVKSGDNEWAAENIEASMPTYEIDYTWVFKPDLSECFSFANPETPKIENLPFSKETLREIVDRERPGVLPRHRPPGLV